MQSKKKHPAFTPRHAALLQYLQADWLSRFVTLQPEDAADLYLYVASMPPALLSIAEQMPPGWYKIKHSDERGFLVGFQCDEAGDYCALLTIDSETFSVDPSELEIETGLLN
jgi:hypothetical protein